MSERPYLGPAITPGLDFHHLPEISQEAIRGTREYIYHPQQLYPDLLKLIAQRMDWTDQRKAEADLREKIASTPRGIHPTPEVRAQRDTCRIEYQRQLASQSAHLALSGIKDSPALESKHQQGLAGGSPIIDIADLESDPFLYRGARTEIRVLGSINPALLNQPLIEEAFLTSILGTTSRRDAFGQAGLNVYSPEFIISLLSRLALITKRHLLNPLIKTVEKLNTSDVYFRGLNSESGKAPLERKREYLEKLILGDPQSPDYETAVGAETFSGILELIYKEREKLLFIHFPPADRARVLRIIETATFMKTSKRKSGQSGENLIAGILTCVAQRDYDSAEREIRRLMVENPKLWPDYIKDLFPIPDEQVEEIAALTNQKKQEQAARSRQKRAEEKAAKPPSPDTHDPSYRPVIDRHLGETLTICDGFSDRTYTIIEYVELRGKPGFVRVKTTEINPDTGITRTRTAPVTYAFIAEIIKWYEQHEASQQK